MLFGELTYNDQEGVNYQFLCLLLSDIVSPNGTKTLGDVPTSKTYLSSSPLPILPSSSLVMGDIFQLAM